ncbi:MAG: glutaredoxin family protein [Planctomycetia bacterium]|nr:glutaredoxin family protein [Planctomycetia bacterium]
MGLVLYTRRGCHLCETALDMLACHGPGITVTVVDVDAAPAAADRFGLRVPVLARDGVVLMEGRFDEAAMAGLLAGKTLPAAEPGTP